MRLSLRMIQFVFMTNFHPIVKRYIQTNYLEGSNTSYKDFKRRIITFTDLLRHVKTCSFTTNFTIVTQFYILSFLIFDHFSKIIEEVFEKTSVLNYQLDDIFDLQRLNVTFE